MATEFKAAEFLSAREFAEALLAGLVVAGKQQIRANQVELHKAFRQVLSQANEQSVSVDLSDVDYDPLYGLSGWLDEFLARAQRDLLISSPNPSYDRIDIKLTAEEGEAILSRYKNPETLKNLSKLFVQQLRT